MKVMIKYDYSTLPKDGQKIRYETLKGKWFEGIFNMSPHRFDSSNGIYHHIEKVCFWEPLD